MRPFRLILAALLAAFLVGCGIVENQTLKDENKRLQDEVNQLQGKVLQLQKYSKEVSAELQEHQSGLQREFQQEMLFRDDLDKAVACQIIFELPWICEPSLSTARAKVLQKANTEGIAAPHGNRYWATIMAAAGCVVLVFFASWAGMILLVHPARAAVEEAEDAITTEQEKIDLAKKEGAAHLASLQNQLASVKQQIEAAKQDLAELEEELDQAEQTTDQANQKAEQAEQAAADLQKKLDLLKAFK